METEPEPAPAEEPFLQLLELHTTWDDMVWANYNIKGKGSRKFLATLTQGHKRGGKSSSRNGIAVSRLAVEIWDNIPQREAWLRYHRATSRLVRD